MVKCVNNIGENIKKIRKEKDVTQAELADACGFTTTALSAYENGHRNPSLETVAKIAKKLEISIDHIYYGNPNIAFIEAEEDEGKKIVNAIFYLWEKGWIRYEGPNHRDIVMPMYNFMGDNPEMGTIIIAYTSIVVRFINMLDDYRERRDTYSKPKEYLEQIKTSIANEINIKLGENRLDHILKNGEQS